MSGLLIDIQTQLQKVAELEQDLSAKIIIEKDSRESCGEYHTGWNIPCDDSAHEKGSPEVSIPNTEKQESSRRQLENIYQNSEWFSVRLAAGRSLGIDSKTLESQVQIWLNILEGQKTAEVVVQEEISHTENIDVQEQVVDGWSPGVRTEYSTKRDTIIDQPKITEPDVATRLHAFNDRIALLYLLSLYGLQTKEMKRRSKRRATSLVIFVLIIIFLIIFFWLYSK